MAKRVKIVEAANMVQAEVTVWEQDPRGAAFPPKRLPELAFRVEGETPRERRNEARDTFQRHFGGMYDILSFMLTGPRSVRLIVLKAGVQEQGRAEVGWRHPRPPATGRRAVVQPGVRNRQLPK